MRPPLLLAACSALVLSSCYSPGDGVAPPLNSLYFPTGLAIDTVAVNANGQPGYLYVASSDFDLQYRSSALASYDLDRVAAVTPRSCAATTDCELGEECDASRDDGIAPTYFCIPARNANACGSVGYRGSSDQLLYPGRCNPVNPVKPQDSSPSLLQDTVGIGAFATDVIDRLNPDLPTQQRLFLPVRGDASLHWIELHDGKFECGQGQTDDRSCDDAHRSGRVPSDNIDQLEQPAEPFATDATSDGKYVAVTNQTTGNVSLFANDWNPNVGPKLVSVLGGLPQAPVALAALPKFSDVLTQGDDTPGFLVAYRNAAEVDLLRVRSGLADTSTVTESGSTSYTRFALTAAGGVPIAANSAGFDSRGIVIDDEQYRTDTAQCSDAACFRAGRLPSIYVANRAPSSLLVGAMTADYSYDVGTSELPSFTDSISLTSGPSRVVLGHVRVATADGFALERRVFVVCFDSRRIFVYDPKRRVVESIINTGRGPYALAVDDARGVAYVAHFTDSYLGVISLDQRFPQTYATIVASIGVPTPPRSSK